MFFKRKLPESTIYQDSERTYFEQNTMKFSHFCAKEAIKL